VVGPDDLLTAAVASSLRRKPARPHRRRLGPADRFVIDGAIEAWKRLRHELFGHVRQIAV
jgi:hypothetical protein